ncbi:MAG: hypothetical protein KDH96_08900 [Candidatus Riesia sp.]|nr:hypothetical protein [Candidatus Riesia sp.]
MLVTIAAFIFSVGGVFTPIDIPDGKGGEIRYWWTYEKSDCLNDNTITFTSGNHGWRYFCEVSK